MSSFTDKGSSARDGRNGGKGSSLRHATKSAPIRRRFSLPSRSIAGRFRGEVMLDQSLPRESGGRAQDLLQRRRISERAVGAMNTPRRWMVVAYRTE